MRHELSPSALPAAARQRARRLQRGVGGALLLALVGALLVGRCAQARHGDEVALREGTAHLKAALAGEGAHWDAAEAALGRAARGALFDAYPIFALTLARRMRAGAWDEVEPALRPAVRALAAGDLGAARRALAAAPGAAGRGWLGTLVDDLEAAGPPPPP